MNNIPKTPREIKRSQLFDLFAKNLQVVKTNPNIHIEPDITDGYVCPICMKFFDRGALSTSEEFRDYLTLEDVPPKVLGGRPITLTCKICNNTAGTELDNHLINKLIYDEAIRGAQNTSIDAILTQENDLKVSVTVHIKPSEKISIRYDPNRSNPNHIKKFQAKLKSGNIGEFSLTLFGKHNENHANIALLRIAYLLAYSYLVQI